MTAMSVKVTINRKTTPVPRAVFESAVRAGLIAGAHVIMNEVKRELRGGYKSTLGNKGDYVTGTSLNHVQMGPPVVGASLAKSYIRVGTDLLYNLFWEIGHHNLFTGGFERDVKWHPAFTRAIPRARAAMWRVFKQTVFAGGKAPTKKGKK